MKAIEIIRWALTTTHEGIKALVADIGDAAALTRPTDAGGNHPLWCVGHMAYIEGNIVRIACGEPNPVEHWAPLFGPGTVPKPDAALYPPFGRVVQAYNDVHARTLELLDRTGDAGLDEAPRNVPSGFEDAMKTVGRSFLLITLHHMVHYGQIADARRVAGLKPLL